MTKTKNDIAWEKLFEKYDILKNIKKTGIFQIEASKIKEFREPRLMTKFDFRRHLPSLFKKNKLSILPISRGKYVISQFNAYKDFNEPLEKIKHVSFPSYIDSIDYKNITSEAIALNCAFLTSIVSDFMEEEYVQPTVSGRMSSLSFNFNIDSLNNFRTLPIDVKNAQIEIDGGYEGQKSLALIEAKNVISSDFIIRQLYYPFRLWNSQIKKKVRPMFLIYSNGIFRFHEYEFSDPLNYNSIRLVRRKNYMIGTDKISKDDIMNIYKTIKISNEPKIPFPQANSFDRVINLLEELIIRDLSKEDIYLMFDIDPRQADYYGNAARYLNLAEIYSDEGITMFRLSKVGKKIMELSYKERQLELLRQVLQHKVFYDVFSKTLQKGRIPEKKEIVAIMYNNYIYNVKSHETYERRSGTISRWINWILNLIEE